MKKAAKHKKELKKTFSFYKLHYGVRPPYNVITDAEFLEACGTAGVDPRRELLAELDEKMTPIVTPDIMRDLRERKVWSAVDHGKTFFYLKDPDPAPVRAKTVTVAAVWEDADTPVLSAAAQSVARRIGRTNPGHYMVATNDKLLRRELGRVPGVPLLHFDTERKKVILTPAGTASKSAAALTDEQKLHRERTAHDAKFSSRIALEQPEADAGAKNPRKRKAQGHNSLSCKKKRTKVEFR